MCIRDSPGSARVFAGGDCDAVHEKLRASGTSSPDCGTSRSPVLLTADYDRLVILSVFESLAVCYAGK